MARLIAMSQSGRHVVIRRADGSRLLDGVEMVDALGTAPRRPLDAPGLLDFGCVAEELWIVAAGTLRRHRLGDGELRGVEVRLDVEDGTLSPAPGENEPIALWSGQTRLLLQAVNERVEVEDISEDAPPDAFAVAISGRRLLIARGRHVTVRDAGRGDFGSVSLPGNEGLVTAGGALFGGRAVAVMSGHDGVSAFDVVKPSGSLVHHIELPRSGRCTIAEARGLALVSTADRKLLAVDLRYGRILGEEDAPIDVADLAIDTNGRFIALAGHRRGGGALRVLHIPYTDLFGGRRASSSAAVRAATAQATSVVTDAGAAEPEKSAHDEIAADVAALGSPAAQAGRKPDEDRTHEPVEPLPDSPLLSLGSRGRRINVAAPPGVRAYDSPGEHLSDTLDLVAAWAARAIADAWDSGRLSLPNQDPRPFQREVMALVGARMGAAGDLLAEADKRVDEATRRVSRRAQATLAAGRSLPLIDLALEFGLTDAATKVLAVAAAPTLRGEIARLYGVLANDEGRPICDRYLVELILAGQDWRRRNQVASELDADAPLCKYGLVRVLGAQSDQYLFAPITVEPVLLSRLRGDPFAATGTTSIATIRHADKTLEQLALPHELKRELVVALADAAAPDRPVRLVLRGRPGFGRTSTMAALGARAGKPLATIDAELLPRGRALAGALQVELRLALLRGAIPWVTGLELLDRDDSEGVEHVRDVLRSHPGPIGFRVSPELRVPLDPGFLDFTIPALTEGERVGFWQEALARRGLDSAGAAALASRFRVGPGTIERVIGHVSARRTQERTEDADATAELDRAARQHIDVRLGKVANHISRLARWEQVALPEDVLDSIREFIGRLKHRRTVYENWGFEHKMATSRGLVALFYGPPGTGKTMVAGLISRELGLDLYRVDLARITSKWIGETEKNLGEVFDAAEDGQALILFDEADSLFAKRTEVKSSVDRYANLEVNYLLQRLDTFEGVAILTTNLEGSIDNAFKRRMSLRLAFPFPDEEMRVRLWAAHIPPEVPTLGDFDFVDLSRRFPMSGGYIRNSALRAAFLAAQEGQPMSQAHLERAISLEYREMGKLAAGGRME
ncbi:MAG TPA: ATP-binding protein [Kofleriaceae bacterium]|nr:ATP-binding protein [Kofleriaceae bacterium]